MSINQVKLVKIKILLVNSKSKIVKFVKKYTNIHIFTQKHTKFLNTIEQYMKKNTNIHTFAHETYIISKKLY